MTEISWKITYLIYFSNLPGANELKLGHEWVITSQKNMHVIT